MCWATSCPTLTLSLSRTLQRCQGKILLKRLYTFFFLRLFVLYFITGHYRLWYDVLHLPSSQYSRVAWKWAELKVSLSQYPDQEHNLARSRKAAVVPVIEITDGTESMMESVLAAVTEGNVEYLDIQIGRITGTIDPRLLCQAVTKVKRFWIRGAPSDLMEAILEAVSAAPDLALETLVFLGEEMVSLVE